MDFRASELGTSIESLLPFAVPVGRLLLTLLQDRQSEAAQAFAQTDVLDQNAIVTAFSTLEGELPANV